MSNIGFATLSVIPSFQGFQSKLTAGTAAPMAAAGKNGGKKFGDAAGREAGESFRGRFSGALKGFAPLAGLAIGAGGIAFLKSAIDGASDLSESGNKINAVFGDAQGQVQTFASTAADALGQTQLQALDAASTFGTFGKAAGLAGSDLAGFSTELVTLATDMASFYNTDVDTAIQAIGSGLRGEAEPLRQFGVLLDDATLRAEALKQGLISSTKEALTPQQKVLASHAVIMRQTTDAQGDFARTSDGLANMQRTLTAQWEEMKTAVGSELLPAMTSFVGFLSDDALPALGEAGGLAKDAVSAFSDLPAPVKAAAAAFVALRIAAATGLTTATASGVASMGSAMDSLRLRTMYAADQYRTLRSGVLEFSGNTGRYVAPVGRMSAALTALGTAANGAGSAMRRGLSGAIGLIGGPWGAALIGGTAILAKFWGEHQEAKQHVDDLKGSLDAQTGAITESTRAMIAQSLEEEGLLKTANSLGIGLSTVTDAAMGNSAALETLRAAQAAAADQVRTDATGAVTVETVAYQARAKNIAHLIDAVTGENEALGEARASSQRLAEATAGGVGATENATGATRDYATELNNARTRVQALMDAEEERRKAAIKNKRDQLALLTVMQDARKEAREGKRTLDENTAAGQANWEALLDVADQWANSSDKVRGARGAYRDMRQNFIDLAKEMGATDRKAERLADRFLTMPDKKRLHIQTPGMDKALADLRLLTKLAAPGGVALETKLRGDSYVGARASGGPVNAGSPYLVGERGPEIVVPKQAGTVLNAKESAAAMGGGVRIDIGTVEAHDYSDFMRQMQRRVVAANGGGVAF